jgi:dimethylhistidine N-methyltransferase
MRKNLNHPVMLKNNVEYVDSPVEIDSTLEEILHGMQKVQKELPPKLFYDEHGSKLFDEICMLEEYYPTRTEKSIMLRNINEIKALVGGGALIIELGSGSSYKTRILLDNLNELAGYIPIDISREQLYETTEILQRIYTELEIIPIWADYNQKIELPEFSNKISRKLAYFPGSTIGNFYPEQAIRVLKNIAEIVGKDGGLLIGVDRVKNSEVLNLAYNDLKGVTAAFNINMLKHINRDFEANFNIDQYKHHAFFNEEHSRIEMQLVSLLDQNIQIADHEFLIKESESILTEVSYKYTLDGFSDLANKAGFRIDKSWTDENKYFSVLYLRVE